MLEVPQAVPLGNLVDVHGHLKGEREGGGNVVVNLIYEILLWFRGASSGFPCIPRVVGGAATWGDLL